MTEATPVGGEDGLRVRSSESGLRLTSSAGSVPKVIAGYELLDEIGRGGMGVVFRARQKAMHREVALKLTLRGEYANELELVRFHSEASTAGNLDHPNIVAVYETGEFDGHAFFSMALIDGGTLANRRDRWVLPEQSAGDLFPSDLRESQKQICGLMIKLGGAVDYAHQRGVLHRDLKPANILLDSSGEPYISDFGLAKQLQSESDLTLSGAVVGTPGFLAPELARGKAKSATTSVDVYALGAILYYLLTGRPPFDGENSVDVLNHVINDDPIPPTRWNSSVDPDLETICLTCLEKDPAKRYLSARVLLDDLARWRENRPIRARPSSALEQGWKWVRRHPMSAALVVVIGASVLSMLFLSERSRQQLKVERDAAYRSEQEANAHRSRAEALSEELADRVVDLKVSLAEDHFLSGRTGEGLAYLAQLMRETQDSRRIAHMAVYELSSRNFLIPSQPVAQPGSSLVALEFSNDSRYLFTGAMDGHIQVWDSSSGSRVAQRLLPFRELSSADLFPDGRRLIAGGKGGSGIVRLVDEDLLLEARLTDLEVMEVAVSPDGKWLAVGLRSGEILVFDANGYTLHARLFEHDERVSMLAFSPDSKRLFSGGYDKKLRLWDVAEGRQMGRSMVIDTGVVAGRFNAAGDRVYSGSYDFTARAWNAYTGEPLTPLMRHATVIHCIDLDASDRVFATGSSDATVQLWDALTGERLAMTFRHDHFVKDLRFVPGGSRLVSASGDATARLWDWRLGEPYSEPLYHATEVRLVAVDPEGQTMATADRNGVVRIVDLGRASAMQRWPGEEWVDQVLFLPTGEELIIGTKEGTVGRIDLNADLVLEELPGHTDEVPKIKFSADGKRFMSISWSGEIHVFDTSDTELLLRTRVNKQLWDASLDRVRGLIYAGGGGGDGELFLIDERSGETLRILQEHTDDIVLTRLSPDGSLLLTGSRDHSALLWNLADAPDMKPAFRLQHDEIISSIDFDPKGERVLTAALDNTAKVWDCATGRQIGATVVHGGWIDYAEFSPDGKRFVTAAYDNTARIWSSETGEALSPPMRHDGNVNRARFDSSGRRVVTCGNDGTIRIWDGHTGEPLSTPLQHRGRANRALFSPDDTKIVVAGPKGVSVWRLPLVPDVAVPYWLPDLVEAIGGLRFGSQETLELVPGGNLSALRDRILSEEPSLFYTSWSQTFFTPSAD